MQNKMYHFLLVVLCSTIFLAGNAKSIQRDSVFLIDYKTLEAQKKQIKHKDKGALEAYEALMAKADIALTCKAFSVTHKKGTPPSGSKHDYMSLSPYWWPNPDAKDGLPYIRKDGKTNPEARNDFTDYNEKDAFFNALKTLRDAYYFSEKESYAMKALELIKAWFLNAETKMNPNLDFGQSVPGSVDGRPFGIIEFMAVTEVITCLELLQYRDLVDANTVLGMKAWLRDYANWLQTSKNGTMEAVTVNNHGTHYDGQLLSIMVYLGDIDFVKNYLNTITRNRIVSQIEPDGSQPHELERTKSFSYSAMNLQGFLYLAYLGKKVGVDVWEMESPDGRSIKKACEYLLPYITKEKEWQYQQIAPVEEAIESLKKELKYAAELFQEKSLLKKISS